MATTAIRGFVAADRIGSDAVSQLNLGGLRRGQSTWCRLALCYGDRVGTTVVLEFEAVADDERWTQVPARFDITLPGVVQNGPGSPIRMHVAGDERQPGRRRLTS